MCCLACGRRYMAPQFITASFCAGWPILMSLVAILAFCQIIIMPSFPESPRYLLIQKGNEEKAREGTVAEWPVGVDSLCSCSNLHAYTHATSSHNQRCCTVTRAVLSVLCCCLYVMQWTLRTINETPAAFFKPDHTFVPSAQEVSSATGRSRNLYSGGPHDCRTVFYLRGLAVPPSPRLGHEIFGQLVN